MRTYIKHLVVLLSLISPLAINAQKYFQKAEKQFELKAYDLAIANYKLALESKEDCIDCVFKIGESYRMQNQSLEAAIWYRKIADQTDLPPSFHLNYGMVMKKMGQFDKAQDHFVKYQQHDPLVGMHYALSCDFAKIALGETELFDLSLYKASSRDADYGPTFFKDKVVFSSFRKDILRDAGKNNGTSLNPLGSQLFTAEVGKAASLENIQFLRADADETFDIANIAYSNDGNICAFSKSSYARSGMEIISDDDDMHLYLAKADQNGNMYNEIPFTFNEVGFSTGFPSLSFDGRALYFSSNRPGGKGGYDIYVSYYKNGDWTYPENLGDNINTSGNEITPSLNNDKLYFASDYQIGIGGFDIFISSVENGGWGIPINAGNGVNSPEDDFYPAIQPGTNTFYFTSNRIGGRGNHDIYIATPIITEQVTLATTMPTEQMPQAVSIETAPTTAAEPIAIAVSATEEVKDTKVVISTPDVVEPTVSAASATFDANSVPPPAVNLDDLAKQAKVGTVSVSNAKKVSYGEVVSTTGNVYFIQLAAIYQSNGNVLPFKSLIEYGNIYKLRRANVTKIKLGYYLDKYEADQMLANVKRKGFTDAFITNEPLNNGDMELVISKDDTNVDFGDQFTDGYTSGTQYKVRLAAYEDAVWFDVNKVKDLGVIEQWSKKDWTIFVLSGYRSYDEAESAKIKAINRGFSDAAVVVDRNGILEQIKSN